MDGVEWVEPVCSVISEVASVTLTILNLIEIVKNNKELYSDISCRLKHLENMLRDIKKYQLSAEVHSALQNLKKVLNSTEQKIKKFNKAKMVRRVLKSNYYKLKVDNLNQRLTNATERLFGALHVHQQRLEEQRRLEEQQGLEEQRRLEEQWRLEEQQKMKSDLERKSSCIIL